MNTQNLILGIVLLGVGTFLGFKCIEAIKQNNSYIATNGLSDRHVVSDEAKWTIKITTEANAVKDAQEKMQKDQEVVLKFLKDGGFSNDEVVETTSEVSDKLRYIYENTAVDKTLRFEIENKIIVKTRDMQKLKATRTKLSDLLSKDIRITDEVQYFYRDFDKLRIEMIKEAAKDSENRAKVIAESLGTKISGVRNLSTGSFSISAEDSSATSTYEWEGERSLNKRIRLVVHGSFNLEH